MPLPVPLPPAVTVIQFALLVAVHPHPPPVAAVTVTVPVPPDPEKLCDVGLTVKLQAAAWVTVTVWPATVSVPVRLVVAVFAATV